MEPFRIDHDYHIHSFLSSCSHDETQTPEAILKYAEENGFEEIVLTNHYWDEAVPGASGWYQKQNTPHIEEALPLPQSEKVRFLFGVETDMDRFFTIGVSKEKLDRFDFIIVPTTHLHMKGFTISEEDGASIDRRRELFLARFRALLDADLPFHKVGLAHLTCELMAREGGTYEILSGIPDETFRELFSRAAKVGMGIELNFDIDTYDEETLPIILRPYRIAKECGCKFYLGSDIHTQKEMSGVKENFEKIVKALELTEADRFRIGK